LLPSDRLARLIHSEYEKIMPAAESARTYFEAYNRHDWAALFSVLADRVQSTVNGDGDEMPAVEYVAALQSTYVLFPDLSTSIDRLIAVADIATVQWTATGTNTGPRIFPDGVELPATGRTMTIHGCDVIETDARGLIVRIDAYWDVATWYLLDESDEDEKTT
jgi:steroid delta-isomerase-like uncharacterized protein